MKTKTTNILALAFFALLVVGASIGWAADTDAEKKGEVTADRAELFKKFEASLTGMKFVGQFTVTGSPKPPAQEEYTIVSVTKLPEGDLWLFKARIKYGDHDITLPMPLPVKWADKTPVITLDELTIPGLGTFSSRVIIDNGKYAGTWTHGKVGGHLFGTIEKSDAGKEKEK